MRQLRIGGLAVPSPYSDNVGIINGKVYGLFSETINLAAEALKRNYTWIRPPPAQFATIGIANSSGHYDGVIGLVQRDEADLAAVGIIVDDLPHDPAYIGAAVQAKEGVLMSSNSIIEERPVDITAAFLSFDLVTWSMLLICCYFAAAMLWLLSVSSSHAKNKSEVSGKRTTRRRLQEDVRPSQMYTNGWNVLAAFLDQVDFQPIGYKKRVVWTSLVMFLFVTFQIFDSKISSNLTVPLTVDRIDSLEDLLLDKFEDVTPTFMPQFQMVNKFSDAAPDTLYGKIWAKATRIRKAFGNYKTHWVINHNVQKDQLQNQAKDSLGIPHYCIIQTELVIKNMKSVYCGINSRYSPHISAQRFDQYVYAYIYSKKLDMNTRNYLDKRLRRVIEGGLYSKAASIGADGFFGDIDFKARVCRGDYGADDRYDEPIPLRYAHVGATFKYGSYGFGICLAVLVLELVRSCKFCRRTIRFIRRHLKLRGRHCLRRKNEAVFAVVK